MTDNNNVSTTPETPETEKSIEQNAPKTGTITITITEAEGGHKVDTNINGSFNGMAFVAGLAGAISAISEAAKVPDFIILAKLIEVHRDNAAKEETEDECKDV